jgi:hypothetical protein
MNSALAGYIAENYTEFANLAIPSLFDTLPAVAKFQT